MNANAGHDPVLLAEVLAELDPQPGQTLIDCTLGRGGHASAIAARLGPTGLLIGLDADPRNLAFAAERLKPIDCPTRLFHANFAEMNDVLREVDIEKVDGLLADLGVSTNQLFDAHYGLSFAADTPLDMRLDPRLDISAADIVNKYEADDLANVLYELAQERFSRRIARKVVEQRRISPIHSTKRLAEIVYSAVPSRSGASEKIDPATRTFMALRMKVNGEMDNLASLLATIPRILKPSGRAAVISFHSMEDRAVKHAFRSLEQTGQAQVLTPRPLSPTEDELRRNPRSRSAKLRVVWRDR